MLSTLQCYVGVSSHFLMSLSFCWIRIWHESILSMHTDSLNVIDCIPSCCSRLLLTALWDFFFSFVIGLWVTHMIIKMNIGSSIKTGTNKNKQFISTCIECIIWNNYRLCTKFSKLEHSLLLFLNLKMNEHGKYISKSASTPSLTFVYFFNVNENKFKNAYSEVPNNSTLSPIITVPLFKFKKIMYYYNSRSTSSNSY